MMQLEHRIALSQATASQLVVVDIQQRLANAMAAANRERVIANSSILLQAAELLNVPVVVSEQYPKGLGITDEHLASCFPSNTGLVEKTCFACTADAKFEARLTAHNRRQIVLTGMESHVCVLQTALGLKAREYAVFVVEDGVCSRHEANHRNALARMRDAGVVITNTESVLFEWLRDSTHEHFKQISALIK